MRSKSYMAYLDVLRMRTAICGVLLAVPVLCAVEARAEDPPVFLLQWGTYGSGPGQFNGALGMAVDANGNVFVNDSGNARVQKFTNSGTYLGEVGGIGSGHGTFRYPYGIAIDGAGRIYVSDSENGLIQVFDNDLVFLRQWRAPGQGALALDPTGQYLYDAVLDTIFTFRVSDGLVVGRWQFDPTGVGRGGPVSFAVGSSGAIYISVHDYVRKFSPAGALLALWGGQGEAAGEFEGAGAIGVDAGEHVYAGDGNQRVQKFSSEGTFLSQWTVSPGYSIAPDQDGGIFILEVVQIQKYVYAPTGAKRESWGGLKWRFRDRLR